jgi:hypothetical protein
VRLLSDPDISDLVIDAAFRGRPIDDALESRLAALGYDPDTSPVDLVGVAAELSVRLGTEIRQEAKKAGSPLFNRLTAATLEELAGRIDGVAPPPTALVPPSPTLVIGRGPMSDGCGNASLKTRADAPRCPSPRFAGGQA